MALPLEQIDTSVIDELVGLKRDREVLAERLARMMAEQEKVSQPVFQRVHADYQSRLQAVEKGAAPKKDQARREYAKLRTLLDEVRTRHETAREDQEELELRQRLGEFEPPELERKRGEIAERIATHERELAEVTAVRERFVAAFDSEDELAPQAPPLPVAPEPPAAASGTTAVQPRSGTLLAPPSPVETVVAPTGETVAPAPLAATALRKDVAPPKAEGSGLGMTMIVTSARLVPLGGGAGVAEYRVQPFTSIGRTRQNQVQLDEPSVSRKHAHIALTDGVYLLTDLQSENGTFVNGERITEQRLSDGDRLQFGSIRFSFHTA